MALYEYRVYEVVPGRMPALHARFRDVNLKYFHRHGIVVVGFWEAVSGTTNELHYIVRYESLAHRERAWEALLDDADWQRDVGQTQRGGPLVARTRNQFWKPTDYSPLP